MKYDDMVLHPATKTITCMDIGCDVRECKERIPIEDYERGCVVFMPGLECQKIKENTKPKPYHTTIAERVEELTKAIINNASHDPGKVRIWCSKMAMTVKENDYCSFAEKEVNDE